MRDSSQSIVLLLCLGLAGCGGRNVTAVDGLTAGDGAQQLDRRVWVPDAAGVRCGNSVCGSNQICCGPPECGRCVPSGSGVYCPATCPDAQVAPGSCVIAIRVDNCCTAPMPAFAQSLATDPCLVAYPPKQPLPAQCLAKWPKKCEVIDCAWAVPASRVVEAIPGGSCNWADECQTDADCVLAINYSMPQCCPCPFAYPKKLMSQNACLIDVCTDDKLCPPPPCPPSRACGRACGPCSEETPHCQKSAAGLNHCALDVVVADRNAVSSSRAVSWSLLAQDGWKSCASSMPPLPA